MLLYKISSLSVCTDFCTSVWVEPLACKFYFCVEWRLLIKIKTLIVKSILICALEFLWNVVNCEVVGHREQGQRIPLMEPRQKFSHRLREARTWQEQAPLNKVQRHFPITWQLWKWVGTWGTLCHCLKIHLIIFIELLGSWLYVFLWTLIISFKFA